MTSVTSLIYLKHHYYHMKITWFNPLDLSENPIFMGLTIWLLKSIFFFFFFWEASNQNFNDQINTYLKFGSSNDDDKKKKNVIFKVTTYFHCN